MESEGRGTKLRYYVWYICLVVLCILMMKQVVFLLKCGATKSPRGFSKGVLCVNAEKLKISQNQVITAREVLEPKSLGTLHDLAI